MELFEKVKLNDGTELTLIPMGIRKHEKSFTLSILTDLSYTELEELLLNVDNISKIQCLSPIDDVLATYTDCISLKSLTKKRGAYADGEDAKDVYVIELSTDKIEPRLNFLNSKVSEFDNILNYKIDLETCTLDELKQSAIAQSKFELEIHFESNPIRSNVHGEDKHYAINREKQALLTQMILVSQLALQNGIPYQPSWNATGEPCTYDWTIEQLQQLAFEIESIVRPLVSYQQKIESTIQSCTTKDDVINVSWNYEEFAVDCNKPLTDTEEDKGGDEIEYNEENIETSDII